MVDISTLWQFLAEGDFFGFLQAIFTVAFVSSDIFYGFLVMMGTGALYIRTHSLIFVGIIWLLLGSLFIVALPLVAGLGLVLMIMGIGSLLYQLFRPSLGSY